MSEQQADYITEAMELLQGPTLEINEPQKVIERRGGKLIESDRPAFVKIYTDFKSELKNIDGDALKGWLFLALSINRYTKDARPGLRKIAEETGLAVNTVRGAIERLEVKYNLLDVEKEGGKGNKYHPSDYVSVSKETVSNHDTVTQTVSKSGGTVSNLAGTVSASRKDFAQLEELELTRLEGTARSLFQVYESEIGVLTPMIADELTQAEKDYPADWIADAIGEAVKNNKRNWKYAAAILKRWKAQGHKNDTRDQKPTERTVVTVDENGIPETY